MNSTVKTNTAAARSLVAACAAFVLGSCAEPMPPMTNAQMAEAIAECKRFGLRSVAMETLSSHEVVRIICKP